MVEENRSHGVAPAGLQREPYLKEDEEEEGKGVLDADTGPAAQ